MFENYLLNPSGITAVLNNIELPAITESQVINWLEENKRNAKYYKHVESKSDAPWTENVNGALLLIDLFDNLSDRTARFDKTVHSPMLTKWILENSAEDLRELSNLIKTVISNP